jgi:hypothetical protein
MIALANAEAARLGAFLALAEADANPADGERLAALAAAERLLARRGLRLRDLAPPPALPPPPVSTSQADLEVAIRAFPTLTEWEQNFVVSLRRVRQFSEKQRAVLHQIAEKVNRR